MTPEIYLTAAFIILLAYLIRGITGFGSGLIAIPLLALFMPLDFVVPLVLVLDFSASIALSRQTQKAVQWRELRDLMPFSIIGLLIGAVLLVNMPHEPLLIALALFVMFFGVRYVFNIHGNRHVSRVWSVPTGLGGGTISAMFGTGGPPYVIYLSHRLRDKTQLRSTLSALFMFEGALRAAIFIYMGLFAQDGMLFSILIALPLMAVSLVLGHKVHVGISNRQQLTIVGVLLLVSGASLLWKVWF